MAKLRSHNIMRKGIAIYPRVRMAISFGLELQGDPGDVKAIQSQKLKTVQRRGKNRVTPYQSNFDCASRKFRQALGLRLS